MERGNMEIDVSLKKPFKRVVFILAGLTLGIVTSEVVHAIYINNPYFEWNGMLQVIWFFAMLAAFLLVAYGIIF